MATTPSLTDWTAQTINYEVYDEGNRFLGHASIDLPEITYQTQDITGAGIAGTVNLPSRWITDSLTMTIHWRSTTQYTMHLAEQRNHDLTLYGAVNSYKSGGAPNYSAGEGTGIHGSQAFTEPGMVRAMPIKIAARCLPKKTTLGKFQPNELMDSESEFEIVYLKITVDGSDELTLDKFNYTLTIHGNDYAADVKSALGLG